MLDAALENSKRMIAALRRPEAFEHAVRDVRVVETHISWVLLTGETAYKIKKPVRFGFVDFSTLEKRQFCCLEQLRLDSRLAPDLYLDVVPITGTFAAPRFGGAGEPIEYALRMKEFPANALLSDVAGRSELSPEIVDALADEIACFHQSIGIADAASEHGTPEAVWRPVFECLTPLRTLPELGPRVDRLETWCRGEFSALEDAISDRKAGGFVRECHGDMHLGNMVLLDRDVLIFDGIEFNASLRWIDVMSEVAFVVMDLDDRGHVESGWRLLNGYLEQTGDYAGLTVLRFYLVYRALVRAKVAVLRLGQLAAGDARRSACEDECCEYMQLAERFTQSTHPALMITYGVSGSGKTVGSELVVAELGALRIRSDVERRRSSAGNASERYSAQSVNATYDRLCELAGSILKAGFSVIVDATFLIASQRRRFHELAAQRGVPFRILRFEAREATLLQRVTRRLERGADASEAGADVVRAQLTTREPLTERESALTIRVDTESAGAMTELVERLRSSLSHGVP